MTTFHHELKHEAAHFRGVSAFGCGVVSQRNVGSPLHQAIEIIGVDGYLVVDGGEPVKLANGVRNERRVVDTLRHIALVARKEEHMVEVQVSCFQHSHHLYSLGRFAMERHTRGANNLGNESFECL